MEDALSAKELAAMVRVVFSRVPLNAEAREEWVLERCAKEVFEALGELTPKMKDACLAELKTSSAVNAKEATAGKSITATAREDYEDYLGFPEEEPLLDEAGQPDLRAVAERHLHDGYYYVYQQIWHGMGLSELRERAKHLSIFESIKALLDESDRLYLEDQLKQCIAEADQLRVKAKVRERLWRPLKEFQQGEAVALFDGDGRAVNDDLRALLAKHGTGAIVEILSTIFADVVKEEQEAVASGPF
jgi:hypothetical protein